MARMGIILFVTTLFGFMAGTSSGSIGTLGAMTRGPIPHPATILDDAATNDGEARA